MCFRHTVIYRHEPLLQRGAEVCFENAMVMHIDIQLYICKHES